MGNKEIQGEYQQIGSEKSVESYSHESPAPAHSQIRYEFSDSATAKPAAKPSGAYNATYNAAKNAAKVVSEEGFSLMDYVDVKPHHKELEDRLLPMFFTEMGDTSELYHLTVTETAADEVSGGQEDVLECHNKNSVGLEQYEVRACTSVFDYCYCQSYSFVVAHLTLITLLMYN